MAVLPIPPHKLLIPGRSTSSDAAAAFLRDLHSALPHFIGDIRVNEDSNGSINVEISHPAATAAVAAAAAAALAAAAAAAAAAEAEAAARVAKAKAAEAAAAAASAAAAAAA